MVKSNFPAATRAIERFMVDTIMIFRNVDVDDQAVDPATLKLITPEPEILYEGRALISPMGDPGEQTIGMGPRNVTYYTVALPLIDLEIMDNDVLVVVAAGNDPQMQDKTFRVEGEIVSSIMVYKRLRARLDTEAS
jgi:hypothetical protein